MNFNFNENLYKVKDYYMKIIIRNGSTDFMISPRERYEREEFWELADEIGMTNVQSNNRTFFQRFFRKNDELTGKK